MTEPNLAQALGLLENREYEQAYSTLVKLADAGSAPAQHALAHLISCNLHRFPGRAATFEDLHHWSDLHENDLPNWQKTDQRDAIKYYTRASEQGSGASSFMLAQLYAMQYVFSDLTWQDLRARATELFERAEQQGFYAGDEWRSAAFWEELENLYMARVHRLIGSLD